MTLISRCDNKATFPMIPLGISTPLWKDIWAVKKDWRKYVKQIPESKQVEMIQQGGSHLWHNWTAE